MKLNFIPENAFKSVIDNKNNIVLFESTINCTNCLNYWIIRDGRDNQVKNAYCTSDSSKQTNLFSSKIKSNLKSKCKGGAGGGSGSVGQGSGGTGVGPSDDLGGGLGDG